MKRYISILALGCAMIGAPALAADLPQRTAAPAPMLAPTPVYSWQGFYVGLSLGYAWENVAYNNFGATTNNFNPNGVIGGGYVGYNFQVAPSVVLGVEGDVEGGSVRQSVNPIALAIPLGSNVTLTNDFRASVRARAGIAMDRALLYATGGAAFGNFNLKSNWGNAFSEQWNVGRSGWTLGAGVENVDQGALCDVDPIVTSNATARAEARHDLARVAVRTDDREGRALQTKTSAVGGGENDPLAGCEMP
jgi:outer membrane immunogenic protein